MLSISRPRPMWASTKVKECIGGKCGCVCQCGWMGVSQFDNMNTYWLKNVSNNSKIEK